MGDLSITLIIPIHGEIRIHIDLQMADVKYLGGGVGVGGGNHTALLIIANLWYKHNDANLPYRIGDNFANTIITSSKIRNSPDTSNGMWTYQPECRIKVKYWELRWY